MARLLLRFKRDREPFFFPEEFDARLPRAQIDCRHNPGFDILENRLRNASYIAFFNGMSFNVHSFESSLASPGDAAG
ncbi:MAG TPA: hypothetical protein VEH04_08200 [Verrucomicrobiae bacterium]|nr:hypothetical protein [Verrucomicrobiae bacterium]